MLYNGRHRVHGWSPAVYGGRFYGGKDLWRMYDLKWQWETEFWITIVVNRRRYTKLRSGRCIGRVESDRRRLQRKGSVLSMQSHKRHNDEITQTVVYTSRPRVCLRRKSGVVGYCMLAGCTVRLPCDWRVAEDSEIQCIRGVLAPCSYSDWLITQSVRARPLLRQQPGFPTPSSTSWCQRKAAWVRLIYSTEQQQWRTWRLYKVQEEAQLSPRDRAMRRVNWNLVNCHGH